MGKRSHRNRSSDNKNRKKDLQKRIEWLEDHIRNNERRSSKRPSSRNRERSRSHRRDYSVHSRYDSRSSPRKSYRRDRDYDCYKSRQYDDRSCISQESEHEIYHDDDKSSEHSAYSNYREERHRLPVGRQSSSNSLINARDLHTSVSPSAGSSNEKEKENNGVAEVTPPIVQDSAETTKAIESSSAIETIVVDKPLNSEKSTGEGTSKENEEIILEPDVLEVFGERFKPDRVLAPPVHSHLTSIWFEIIEKGLPAEERKNLLKKFPPPKNCILIDPPKLNLEVKAALDSTIQKRDERIVEKQEKIAASLAGVGKAIELLLKSNPPEKKQYLEPLTAVSKFLADLQHDETSIRRSLILKNIKAPFKDTLKDVSSDEYLFGKDLTEKLKAAKVLQQSSKDLKPSIKHSFDQGKNSKNLRAPPHQNHYKSNPYSRGGGYRQNYGRGNNYSRGNKSSSRGKSHYQKPEQTSAKKSN